MSWGQRFGALTPNGGQLPCLNIVKKDTQRGDEWGQRSHPIPLEDRLVQASFSTSHRTGIYANVTVHQKTRYIDHFGGNEALTELISMQTAESSYLEQI